MPARRAGACPPPPFSPPALSWMAPSVRRDVENREVIPGNAVVSVRILSCRVTNDPGSGQPNRLLSCELKLLCVIEIRLTAHRLGPTQAQDVVIARRSDRI